MCSPRGKIGNCKSSETSLSLEFPVVSPWWTNNYFNSIAPWTKPMKYWLTYGVLWFVQDSTQLVSSLGPRFGLFLKSLRFNIGNWITLELIWICKQLRRIINTPKEMVPSNSHHQKKNIFSISTKDFHLFSPFLTNSCGLCVSKWKWKCDLTRG